MSGIYIPGMEMPKNCRFCKLAQTDDGYVCSITGDAYSWGLDGPPSDCPLVPVPPHGDLIDYDFCIENYVLLHDDDGNPVYAVRMRDINNAPTIIPAEEVDE